MRIHPRKAVSYAISSLILFLLGINLYKHNVWLYQPSDQSEPWKNVYQREKTQLKYTDNKFHDHVRRVGQFVPITNTTGIVQPPIIVTMDHNVNIVTEQSMVTMASIKNTIHHSGVWYSPLDYTDDRIVSQLKHIPRSISDLEKQGKSVPLKQILVYHGVRSAGVKRGQDRFKDDQCPVNQCTITDDKKLGSTADAIFFSSSPARPWTQRPLHQIWAVFMLESPYHTASYSSFGGVMNWTATYRRDSTIVAPYEKFVQFDDSILTKPQNRSYAQGKTKMVAWFVSNCGARNGRRKYVDELAEHIDVDIYGSCGTLKCARSNPKCATMLDDDYKFYIAFENSNCRDYITEKYFRTGLQ
jgi:hypothetical protein